METPQHKVCMMLTIYLKAPSIEPPIHPLLPYNPEQSINSCSERLYKVKYVENENGIEKAREASLLEIIEGIPPNVTPELPWVIDNGHALFKKDKEELLIEQSITQNINLKFNVEEDVYGTIRFLSPKHNLILQDMRNYSLRSREICEMFCQMLIAERFNR